MKTKFSQLSVTAQSQLLGQCLSLCWHSEIHNAYHVNDLATVLLPPLEYGQYVLMTDTDHRAVGFASWACVSDEIHHRFKSGPYPLPFTSWKSGTHIWFMDFIAPFGHYRELIRQIKPLLPPWHKANGFRLKKIPIHLESNSLDNG